MDPVSPVLFHNSHQLKELVFAENQKPYRALPAIRTEDGFVISRWHLSFRERLSILFFGNIWLFLFMGLDRTGRHRPLTPSLLTSKHPEFTPQPFEATQYPPKSQRLS